MAKKETKSKASNKPQTTPVEKTQDDMLNGLIDQQIETAKEEVEEAKKAEPTAPIVEEAPEEAMEAPAVEEVVMTEKEAQELGEMIDNISSGKEEVIEDNEAPAATVKVDESDSIKPDVAEVTGKKEKKTNKPHAMRSGFGYYWNGWCCDE